jgi:hypothetical protein
VRFELPSITLVIDSKDLVIHLYCGPKNMKLVFAYTLFKDLDNGNFVLVRPHDLFLVPIWLGRTHNVKDDQNEFFKMVKVQWWVLMKKGQIQMNNICMKFVGMTNGNVIRYI